MPEHHFGAAVAALVAVLVSGCSQDEVPTTGAGTGAVEGGGTSASVPFELVATDQLAISPDGSQVMADCWNGICRWDAIDGTLELVPDRGSAAVSPDWSSLAVVGDDAAIVLEDLDSGDPTTELAGVDDGEVADGSPVTAVAYSPDGALVAASSLGSGGSGTLHVWSVDDGTEQTVFDTAGEVHGLAFSPDGQRVATAGNGPVEVHDIGSGDSRELGSGRGGTVAWSADGGQLVGPGADGQPVVWNTATWAPAAELRGVRLHEAAFAPDDDVLALTSLDDTVVTLWTPAAQTADVHELAGHSTAPGAVAWSPDGDVLYSVAAEDGVLAWDPERRTRADVVFEVPEGR